VRSGRVWREDPEGPDAEHSPRRPRFADERARDRHRGATATRRRLRERRRLRRRQSVHRRALRRRARLRVRRRESRVRRRQRLFDFRCVQRRHVCRRPDRGGVHLLPSDRGTAARRRDVHRRDGGHRLAHRQLRIDGPLAGTRLQLDTDGIGHGRHRHVRNGNALRQRRARPRRHVRRRGPRVQTTTPPDA